MIAFVSAALPAQGVSASFDLLCRQYRPTKALQMILRRALEDYEMMLDSGTHAKGPATYAILKSTEEAVSVKTSRMIPVRLVEIARAHFDPLGLESTRAFGLKLASAALAAFFKAEAKRENPGPSSGLPQFGVGCFRSREGRDSLFAPMTRRPCR